MPRIISNRVGPEQENGNGKWILIPIDCICLTVQCSVLTEYKLYVIEAN